MKKFLVFLITIVLVVGNLVGCSGKNETVDTNNSTNEQNSSATSETDSKYKITFVSVKSKEASAYWAQIIQGVEDASKELNCTTEIVYPETPGDANQFQKLFDVAIVKGVNGIVASAYGTDKSENLINKAAEAGTRVALVDTDAANSKRIFAAGSSQETIGKEAATSIRSLVNKNANVIVICDSTNPVSILRGAAFVNALKDSGVNVKSTVQTTSDSVEKMKIIKDSMDANKDVTAFFATTASDTLTIAKIIETNGEVNKYSIVGTDDTPDNLSYISKGIIQSVVAQKPYKMGYDAIKNLKDVLDGKTINQSTEDTGVELVNKDNITSYNKK